DEDLAPVRVAEDLAALRIARDPPGSDEVIFAFLDLRLVAARVCDALRELFDRHLRTLHPAPAVDRTYTAAVTAASRLRGGRTADALPAEACSPGSGRRPSRRSSSR